jgi:hypothetical protein
MLHKNKVTRKADGCANNLKPSASSAVCVTQFSQEEEEEETWERPGSGRDSGGVGACVTTRL